MESTRDTFLNYICDYLRENLVKSGEKIRLYRKLRFIFLTKRNQWRVVNFSLHFHVRLMNTQTSLENLTKMENFCRKSFGKTRESSQKPTKARKTYNSF